MVFRYYFKTRIQTPNILISEWILENTEIFQQRYITSLYITGVKKWNKRPELLLENIY